MGQERQLTAALIEFADTLVDDYDLLEFLYSLSDRCVELFDASAAGVLLGPEGGDLGVIAASTQEARTLELFEFQHQQGPAYDAYRLGHPVVVDDLAREQRWPEFVCRALDIGYCKVTAQPLIVRGHHLGALNLFSDTPEPWRQETVDVARGLADMAAIGLINERAFQAADQQIFRLKQALDSRASIEQAKAIMADRAGIDHGEAFRRLRRYARDRNEKLHEVAQRFVEGDLAEDAFAPEE